jgi:WD40 repeat protein
MNINHLKKLLLDGHESTVWSSDFSPEGDVLISCSDDKTLKLWKTETSLTGQSESNWQCFSTISGYHDRTIYSVKWSKYNNLIATADGSNSVHIFKYNQNAGGNDGGSLNLLYQKINAHDQDCNCVDWNPMKPNILVTCSDDSYIKIWEFCEE